MSAQLRDYFRSEAEDYITALEQAAGALPIELAAVRKSARGLSGLARLAGEPHILRAATAIDHVSRTTQPAQAVSLGSVLREALPHFRILVAANATDSDIESHVAAIVERCTIEEPGEAGDEGPAVDEANFHEFVHVEATEIADALDRGIADFTDDPLSRDALGTILQRQRSLLGAARLSEMGSIAETLRAVEDITELIVRLEVPVKSEWLDVFRTAREVLRAGIERLAAGDIPGPSHALSRLRVLREELVDRYGDREATRVHPAADGLAADTATHERADRLRMELMNAIGANARARAALEELYTLAMRAGS